MKLACMNRLNIVTAAFICTCTSPLQMREKKISDLLPLVEAAEEY